MLLGVGIGKDKKEKEGKQTDQIVGGSVKQEIPKIHHYIQYNEYPDERINYYYVCT